MVIDVIEGRIDESTPWSTQAEWFDWVVIAVTIVLAAMTVWVGSSMLRGPFDYLLLSPLWALVGAAWTVTVLLRTTDTTARMAASGLLVGALLSILVFGPVTLLVFMGPSELVVVGLLVAVPVAVLVLRQRPIHLVWLVAPSIVIAVAALVVSGIPASVRFASAEPELTRYVEGLSKGVTRPDWDHPTTVAGVPIYEVIREERQTLLVTGFIGILGDDPAGLAYVPDGTPVGVGWSHIRGSWYSWVPLGYVPD